MPMPTKRLESDIKLKKIRDAYVRIYPATRH